MIKAGAEDARKLIFLKKQKETQKETEAADRKRKPERLFLSAVSICQSVTATISQSDRQQPRATSIFILLCF